LLKSRHFNR